MTAIWTIVLVGLLAAMIWVADKNAIRYAVLYAVYWGVFPFTAISDTASRVQQTIASHPLDFWGPGQLLDLYGVAAKLYWRWPVMAIFVGFAISSFARSKRMRYSAALTLETLARLMVQENAHIAPTLKLSAYDQPLDGGLLPAPERPIVFAVNRGLLLDGDGNPVKYEAVCNKNGTLRKFLPDVQAGRHPIGNYVVPARLDEVRAAQIFAAQLKCGFLLGGKTGFDPTRDLKHLPEWVHVLIAAMYAYGADKQGDANRMLEHLSYAWHPAQEAQAGGWQWKGFPLKWRSIDDLVDGKIDWPMTTEPAKPVFFDETYVMGAFPGLPASVSPIVRVKRSAKGFGADWVSRLEWRWKGRPTASAIAPQRAGFSSLPDGYKAILAAMMKDESFLEFTRLHHRHFATWMMSLMEWAQTMGSFHTSLFIWLRVQNRHLFWVLNQVGGECAWTQAAGPWTHYRTEIMARSPIEDPAVDLAVQALEKDLKQDGWFDPDDMR